MHVGHVREALLCDFELGGKAREAEERAEARERLEQRAVAAEQRHERRIGAQQRAERLLAHQGEQGVVGAVRVGAEQRGLAGLLGQLAEEGQPELAEVVVLGELRHQTRQKGRGQRVGPQVAQQPRHALRLGLGWLGEHVWVGERDGGVGDAELRDIVEHLAQDALRERAL